MYFITMGCDYYIIKFLNIYYNDIDYLVIELDREKGYYNFQYDEDCDDYTDNKFIDGVEYIRVHKQDNRSFLMRKDTLKKISK